MAEQDLEALLGKEPESAEEVVQTDEGPDEQLPEADDGQEEGDAAADTDAEAEVTPAAGGLFDKLKGHGIDFTGKYKTEDDLVAGIANLTRKIGERDEYARIGKYLNDHPQEAYEWLRQQYEKQQQQEKPPEEPKAKPAKETEWDAPEWRDDWLEQVSQDDDGNIVVRPGGDPTIPAKIAKFHRWQTQFMRRLATNPQEALGPVIDSRLKPALERATKAEERAAQLEAKLANQRQMDSVQDVVAREAGWMFQGGRVEKDNFTPAGRMFAEVMLEETRRNPQEEISETAERCKQIVYGRLSMMAAMAQAQQQPEGKPTPNRQAAVRKPSNAKPSPKTDGVPKGKSLVELLSESVESHPPTKPPWEIR